jgi:antitoxin component of MazEF toxin-antitoxin module
MHTRKPVDTSRVLDDATGQTTHETSVFKAGNSLAIRISSAIAKQADLENGTTVEIVVDDGTLCVRKAQSRQLTDLIARITADNIHEPEFENLIGAERW